MATRINADGSRERIAPAAGEFTLAELQAIVGGYIEAVCLRDGSVMMVNEEGKLQQLPFNEVATHIAQVRGFLPFDDCIVGNVVIGTRCEMGGPDDGDDES